MNHILTSHINIITGNNGSGKSTILSHMAIAEISNGKNVIAISNATTNKFKRKKSSRYNILKQSSNSLDICLKKLIINHYNAKSKNDNHIHIYSKILDYQNFDNVLIFNISFKVSESKLRFLESETYKDEHNEEEIYELISYLRNSKKFPVLDKSLDKFKTPPVRLNLTYKFGFEWDNSAQRDPIELICKYERKLRSLGIISSMELSLSRGIIKIKTSHLSSGESIYLTNTAFILTHLDNETVIFIDEPENSLHPELQKKYTSNLLNLLGYYNIKLILATHSPMIVIGAAEDINDSLDVFMANDGILSKINGGEVNIDEVMTDVFGVLTSRSRYFSYKINSILNQFNENKSIPVAIKKLNSLYDIGPDKQQTNIIEAAKNHIVSM